MKAQSLYSQSLQTALSRAHPDVEFLLYDLRTHTALANNFPDRPIPPGSLVKPFVALGYAANHSGFPTITCRGHADQCWRAGGHGALTLPEALAQSCNAYFLALARDTGSIPYLPAPPANASPETLIGLTAAWLISPGDLVQAYAALVASAPSSTRTAIFAGLRASATHGTGTRTGVHPGGVLTKTGTAPCLDPSCKANGDGLILVAVPATNPTLLLLVRQRATTGAMTAPVASRIVTQLKSLHAY